MVPKRRLRIYTASKLAQSEFWKRLAKNWPEHDFISRWVHLHVGTTPDAPCFAQIFWQHDHEDVARCDVLILYGDKGEKLRGGLVEAGMAIALGKYVIVVGDHPDYGTWQYHPQVYRADGWDEARMLLKCFTMDPIVQNEEWTEL